MIIILETSCFLPLSGSGAVSEKKFRRRKSNKLEKTPRIIWRRMILCKTFSKAGMPNSQPEIKEGLLKYLSY